MLIDDGIITSAHLEKAKKTQHETGSKFVDMLEQLGYASKETIAQYISEHYDIPKIRLSLDLIDPDVVKTVSPKMARKYHSIPIMVVANILTVAMADPLDLVAMDSLRIASGRSIEPVICSEEEMLEAMDFFLAGRVARAHQWLVGGVDKAYVKSLQTERGVGSSGAGWRQDRREWMYKIMSKNRRGFTLVEIMLVVGIIGLLAPLAVLSFTVARERAREAACLDNRRVVEGVEQQFRVNVGRYSTTLYELIDRGYVK